MLKVFIQEMKTNSQETREDIELRRKREGERKRERERERRNIYERRYFTSLLIITVMLGVRELS